MKKKVPNYVHCVPICLNNLFIEYILYARLTSLHVFISLDSRKSRRKVQIFL